MFSERHNARDLGLSRFRIGRWRVDPLRNRISRGRRTTSVEPRVMRVLVALAEAAPGLVSRDALQQTVWKGVVVTPNSLTNAISDLRRAFAEDASHPRVVETVRGAGYRLALPVFRVATRRQRLIQTAAAGATLTVVLGLGFGLLDRQSASPGSQVQHALSRLTTLPGVELDPKFSPDGGRVAFVWFDSSGRPADIYVKSRVDGRATRVTTAFGAELSPAWSPDGNQLAFVSNDGTCHLNTVAADGGSVTRLAALSCGRSGLAWAPDGQRIAFIQQEGPGLPGAIHTIDVVTRTTVALTSPGTKGAGDYAPKFAPDGKTLAFLRSPVQGASDLYTVNVATRDTERQTFNASAISGYDWAADGRSLLVHGQRDGVAGLWRVSPDARSPSLIRASTDVDAGSISVDSRSGDVVFTSWRYDVDLWRSDIGSTAPARRLSASTRLDAFPAVAPSGDSLAFVSARAGTADIWISDLLGRDARRLTQLGHNALRHISWSPDGTSILFESVAGGRAYIGRVIVGTGAVVPLARDAANPTWSRDGSAIYYTTEEEGVGEIRRVFLESAIDELVLPVGSYGAREISGGGILYTRRDAKGIWRADLHSGEQTGHARIVEDTAAEDLTTWIVQSEKLYYLRRANLSMDYEVVRLDADGNGRRVATIPTEIVSPFQRFGFALSADEKALYYGHLNPPESDLVVLERS